MDNFPLYSGPRDTLRQRCPGSRGGLPPQVHQDGCRGSPGIPGSALGVSTSSTRYKKGALKTHSEKLVLHSSSCLTNLHVWALIAFVFLKSQCKTLYKARIRQFHLQKFYILYRGQKRKPIKGRCRKLCYYIFLPQRQRSRSSNTERHQQSPAMPNR